MKIGTVRKMGWIIPTLALTVGLSGLNPVAAQTKAPTKTAKSKTDKPKSKTVYGTFSQANTTGVKIKNDKEELSATLIPTTVYWRTQKSVPAANLKVGETVKMSLSGTDDLGRVESLSPLTLKFGDDATLVYGNPSKMRFVRIAKIGASDVVAGQKGKFVRIAKIGASDVVAGQKGKVASNVYPDGKIEAREVWVDVEPEKPTSAKKE